MQRSMLGQIVNVQVCPNCKGIGYIGGRDKNTATIKVKIPAGVSDGNYMTLEGEGRRIGMVMNSEEIRRNRMLQRKSMD